MKGLEDVEANANCLEDFLEDAFKKYTTEEWLKKLERLDVGVHRVTSLEELRREFYTDDPISWKRSIGFYNQEYEKGLSFVLTVQNSVRMRNSELMQCGPSPKYGAHTIEVLEKIGLSQDAIAKVLETGGACESWTNKEKYLPT